MNSFSVITDHYLNSDFREIVRKFNEENIDVSLDPLLSRVLSVIYYYGLSGEKDHVKALDVLLNCDAKDSKVYLSIGLIYLNRCDLSKAIEYLELVDGDMELLATFFLSYIYSYKYYGIDDYSLAMSTLSPNIQKGHLCSILLYTKLKINSNCGYLSKIVTQLWKNYHGIKCAFIALRDPADVRLLSQGGFECFGAKFQRLIEQNSSGDNLMDLKCAIYYIKPELARKKE